MEREDDRSVSLTRRNLLHRAAAAGAVLAAGPTLLRTAAAAAATRVRGVRTAVPVLHPLPTGAVRVWERNWHQARNGPPAAYDHRSSPGRRAHNGNDLFCAAGTPVRAAVSGRVRRGSLGRPYALYGKTVGIEDVSGPATAGNLFLYAHLQSVTVNEGEYVHQGQVIGTAGATGNAAREGPQVHFEVRLGAFTCPACSPSTRFRPTPGGHGFAVDPAPTLARAKRLRPGRKLRTKPTDLGLGVTPSQRPGEYLLEVRAPRALAGKYVDLQRFEAGHWRHDQRLLLDARSRATARRATGTYRASFRGYNAHRPATSPKLQLPPAPLSR